MAPQALGHLAARGVPGAQDQYALFVRAHHISYSRKDRSTRPQASSHG
jgi:hypothetical protein